MGPKRDYVVVLHPVLSMHSRERMHVGVCRYLRIPGIWDSLYLPF